MLLGASVSFIVCLASVLCGLVSMAQSPESTLVVVNKESPDSLAIANRYIQLRNISAVNVVYLRGITTSKRHGSESSTSKAFQQEILNPILKAMRVRGIEDQIDCITYSAGFPTRIFIRPEVNRYLKTEGKKYSIQFHAPWASITSLTYFCRNAFSDSPSFLELDANRFAGPRSFNISENPFVGDDARQFREAIRSMKSGDDSSAIKNLLGLARKHPRQMAVVYALGRVKKRKLLRPCGTLRSMDSQADR